MPRIACAMPRIARACVLLAAVCYVRPCAARAHLSSGNATTTTRAPPAGANAFSVSQTPPLPPSPPSPPMQQQQQQQQQRVAPINWGALLAFAVLCPAQAVVDLGLPPSLFDNLYDPATSGSEQSPPSPPHSPPPPPWAPHPPHPPPATDHQALPQVESASLDSLLISFTAYAAVCWTPFGSVADVALQAAIHWLTTNHI